VARTLTIVSKEEKSRELTQRQSGLLETLERRGVKKASVLDPIRAQRDAYRAEVKPRARRAAARTKK